MAQKWSGRAQKRLRNGPGKSSEMVRAKVKKCSEMIREELKKAQKWSGRAQKWSGKSSKKRRKNGPGNGPGLRNGPGSAQTGSEMVREEQKGSAMAGRSPKRLDRLRNGPGLPKNGPVRLSQIIQAKPGRSPKRLREEPKKAQKWSRARAPLES